MHHLTHIENLEKIIKDGFLKSRNFMDSKFTDTANQSIINSRSNVNGKNLNNYVPFHWNNFQKDYKIPYNTDVLGRVGCENMIFLSGKIPEFSTNLYFLFHPTSQYKKEYTDFDKYLEYLTKEHGFLQKEAYLKNPWWELDFSDNKVKQFLMSEILILEKYPVKYLTDIFVYSLDAKKIVQDALNKYRITHIEIRVEPNFFKK